MGLHMGDPSRVSKVLGKRWQGAVGPSALGFPELAEVQPGGQSRGSWKAGTELGSSSVLCGVSREVNRRTRKQQLQNLEL